MSLPEVASLTGICILAIAVICWIYWPEVKEDIEMVRNWFRGAA